MSTRPAGRQDYRAMLWRVIRYEATTDATKLRALRMLALFERADLGDPDAEEEVADYLEGMVVDEDGWPKLDEEWIEPTEAPKETA